jgi:choline dehydrogenase-like flavoprotein
MAERNGRHVADYVIVGAGSAGCALAYRLSEDPDASVLVVEAGGWDRDPWIHIPIGWVRILLERRHDWMYFCEPEEGMAGRAIECARGKVVGGSSSTNAMAWVRGNPRDFDGWAAGGLPGWGYADVLPYFKRLERWEGGETAYRGGSGPIGVKSCAYDDPLVGAFREASVAAGLPFNPDYNAARQEGVGVLQMNIAGGRRASSARAYLRPALRRPNCRILVGAEATTLTFDGARATGVALRRNGRAEAAIARREVILAGGVINSPKLLMLSGIGDADALARHGIAVRAHLPGVGCNLQDHISTVLMYARREPGPFHRMMRLDRIGREVVKAHLFGTGFATEVPGGAVAFVRTEHAAGEAPDIQIILTAAPILAKPYFPGLRKPFDDAFAVRVVQIQPESRGTVTLASADPFAAPLIRQNFFVAGRDVRSVVAGVRRAKEIAAGGALAPFVAREIAPGEGASDAAIEAHARAVAITLHHPAGTCRMGPDTDPEAVVDGEMRVRGIDGLRVVDGSAMPRVTAGNIHAPITMMAEKAADMIRGLPPLAPARL